MKTKYIDEIDQLESTHWWHLAKKNLIIRLINSYGTNSPRSQILEIGAGSGNLLSDFAKKAHTTALDINKTALKHCKKRGIEYLICKDIETYKGFKKNHYDVIIAADILEHIKKDDIVAKKIYRMLKKNGNLIVHVPAGKSLFSYWDKMMGHQRRYSETEILKLLKNAGFSIRFNSYRLFLLYPLAYIYRKLDTLIRKKNTKKASDFKQFPVLNTLFLWLTSIEDLVLCSRLIRFPWGLSLIVVASK